MADEGYHLMESVFHYLYILAVRKHELGVSLYFGNKVLA